MDMSWIFPSCFVDSQAVFSSYYQAVSSLQDGTLRRWYFGLSGSGGQLGDRVSSRNIHKAEGRQSGNQFHGSMIK